MASLLVRPNPPHRKVHDLGQRRSKAIPQCGPTGWRRWAARRIPTGICRGVAECVGEDSDEDGQLVQVNRTRCHAYIVSPMAQDDLPFIGVSRHPKICSSAPGIRDVQPLRKRTHQGSMHLPPAFVDRQGATLFGGLGRFPMASVRVSDWRCLSASSSSGLPRSSPKGVQRPLRGPLGRVRTGKVGRHEASPCLPRIRCARTRPSGGHGDARTQRGGR